MSISATLLAEAVKPRSGKAWLWLYEIELETTTTESRWVLLTSHHTPVTFNSETYNPHRCSHEAIDSGQPGSLAEVALGISNARDLPASYLRAYGGLIGNRVNIRLVQEDLLTPANSMSNLFEVVGSEAALDQVTLNLGHLPLNSIPFPGPRFSRYSCRFRFGDPRTCAWTSDLGGDATACDLTLDGANGCLIHGNVPRFGGFPAMP